MQCINLTWNVISNAGLRPFISHFARGCLDPAVEYEYFWNIEVNFAFAARVRRVRRVGNDGRCSSCCHACALRFLQRPAQRAPALAPPNTLSSRAAYAVQPVPPGILTTALTTRDSSLAPTLGFLGLDTLLACPSLMLDSP